MIKRIISSFLAIGLLFCLPVQPKSGGAEIELAAMEKGIVTNEMKAQIRLAVQSVIMEDNQEHAQVTVPAQSQEQAAATVGFDSFDKLNGISLGKSENEIIALMGEPPEVKDDTLLPDQYEWGYGETRIGFYEGRVKYVSVLATAKNVRINSETIRMDKQSLKKRFGEPDLIAGDGVVYIENNKAIKIFLHPETGALVSIDLFYSH